MKTPVRALSSHLHRDKYDIVIIGSGNRAKTYHRKVCEHLKASGHIDGFIMVPARSEASRFAVIEARLWVVVVPQKHRVSIYMKLFKAGRHFEKLNLLVETPVSFLDILFSFTPFFHVRILEAANMNFNVPVPCFYDSKYSYHDMRFGADHAYAIYFRFMGVIKGLFFLIRRKVKVSRKKSDIAGIVIESSQFKETFFLAPATREQNEINLLKIIFKEALSGKVKEQITVPFINKILKFIFFFFKLKV